MIDLHIYTIAAALDDLRSLLRCKITYNFMALQDSLKLQYNAIIGVNSNCLEL